MIERTAVAFIMPPPLPLCFRYNTLERLVVEVGYLPLSRIITHLGLSRRTYTVTVALALGVGPVAVKRRQMKSPPTAELSFASTGSLDCDDEFHLSQPKLCVPDLSDCFVSQSVGQPKTAPSACERPCLRNHLEVNLTVTHTFSGELHR